MKKKFLLDTNTLSSLVQKYADNHAIISSKASSINDNDEIYVSIVSLYEMEYGARHAKDIDMANEMRAAIESVKNNFSILALSEEGAKIFAEIKERYKQEAHLGKKALITQNIDLMIASTALEIGAILVSNDHKIFALIQKIHNDFQWENWTQ
ncbi:type II toxin-antitoxin system VapC family toxin [Candidatus Parabeggiatoa sp. HSG14]|uniref:type II toxin-antitoxin system VapC family toxin n=1 Tax=Candidatus Parabeggiatoa sp. HSG14 TaxID=3055593 RepID=UPI0025A8C33F|nr:type II toxin-antitoxin system VapC family toxin [Thiotrichales bacterium HSG14]